MRKCTKAFTYVKKLRVAEALFGPPSVMANVRSKVCSDWMSAMIAIKNVVVDSSGSVTYTQLLPWCGPIDLRRLIVDGWNILQSREEKNHVVARHFPHIDHDQGQECIARVS